MNVYNIQMWIVSGLLWAVGLSAWIMTYILVPIKAKKTEKNISGIPGVAFILFLMAGLLSPYKLLALLCLIDFSVIWLVFELISAWISGDLKYDWGRIYLHRMQALGYKDLDESVKTRFDEYYKKCKGNKEYKKTVKKRRYDYDRFCRIVASVRTNQFIGCEQDQTYSVEALWGMTEWDYKILKEILPEDVRELVLRK